MAGVNRSTVSKALRNSKEINAETARQIRSIARKIGYNFENLHSDVHGRKVIGVVFPELKSLYYHKIYDAFRVEMDKQGYRIITMLYNFADVDRQIDDINFFIQENVSGILYLTESVFDVSVIHSLFEDSCTKLVMITLNNELNFCDTICNNHSVGIRLGVEHLYQLGHRKIAFIGEKHTLYRRNEFITAMSRLNLAVREDYIVETNERFEECGYIGMKKLLSLQDLPTACFAAYDNVAYGAMKALREAGLSIPDDMSILGVDDNTVSSYVAPPLTSINSPETEIGKNAARFLMDRINNVKVPFRSTLICPTIRKRESTAAYHEK